MQALPFAPYLWTKEGRPTVRDSEERAGRNRLKEWESNFFYYMP